MANTMFGAMSGVRLVNWESLIQEYMEKSLPHIGRKPSFISPYILHLYQQYGCINYCRGRGGVQIRAASRAYGSKNGGIIRRPCRPRTTPSSSHSSSHFNSRSCFGDRESRRPTASKRRRSQQGASVEEHRPLHLGASGNSFQAGPSIVDQPAERVLEAGAHHPWIKPGVGVFVVLETSSGNWLGRRTGRRWMR
jgi:hypothetical protein